MTQGHTQTGRLRRAREVALAAALVACLSGCEVAGFTLPDIPLPQIDLSQLSLPEFDIPFLEEVDPAEALQALAKPSSDLTEPAIHEAGVLTVGVNTRMTLAPMVISPDGVQIQGMDVDVAAALADELGLRVRFVAVDDTDAAVDGTVDVVLSASSDSVKSATVVGSYAESALAFFRTGEQQVVAVEDLMGATVGVQSGSASAAALEHTALGMTVTEYATLNDAFAALEAGEVSYVLCDAYAGAYLAASYDDISLAGCLDAPTSRGVAVVSSNVALQQAIQQALDTIASNGVLDVMRGRWVGTLPTPTTDQQIQGIPMVEEEKPEEGEQTEGDEGATADDGSEEASD